MIDVELDLSNPLGRACRIPYVLSMIVAEDLLMSPIIYVGSSRFSRFSRYFSSRIVRGVIRGDANIFLSARVWGSLCISELFSMRASRITC